MSILTLICTVTRAQLWEVITRVVVVRMLNPVIWEMRRICFHIGIEITTTSIRPVV
jgi:hypothetical protein